VTVRYAFVVDRAFDRIRHAIRIRTRLRKALAQALGGPDPGDRQLLEPRIEKLEMERWRSRGFASQFGQDVLLHGLFRSIGQGSSGVFVDVGAHDGVSHSNSLFFERERGWSGVCIEPLPEPFGRLQHARTARCFNCAIAETEGEQEFMSVTGYSEMLSGLVAQYDRRHIERIENELVDYGGSNDVTTVAARRLDDVLEECGIRHIDFLSIDVEGGELAVLRSMDFTRTTVIALTVENGYDDDRVARFLAGRTGLRRVLRVDVDDIYVDLTALSTRLGASHENGSGAVFESLRALD
jgi:FkbM family methyltransferase